MKEKKIEENKDTKTKNKIITKERVVLFVFGIFIGALITSCVFCIYINTHNHKTFEHEKVRLIDKNRKDIRRKHNKFENNQEKSTDKIEESKTEKSSDNSTQSNNKMTY